MSEDQMKPCPFCGGEAERIDIPTDDEMDENAGGSCIQCNRCAASTALHFDRKENLISSWNDRVVDRSGNEFVKRLRDRALLAREEDTATALGDALHFEEAAERLNALTARVAELEAENERLRGGLLEHVTDNLWNAYHSGIVRDGAWTDGGMTDAKRLRRELGLDHPGHHDAEMIEASIPELAAKLVERAALEPEA